MGGGLTSGLSIGGGWLENYMYICSLLFNKEFFCFKEKVFSKRECRVWENPAFIFIDS